MSTGKILHITDFHIDPFYKVGGSIRSACHRIEEGDPGAGVFGNRKCDTPIILAKTMLELAKAKVDEFDFILLTGDNSRHDNDTDGLPKTPEETIGASRMIKSTLSQHFPSKPIVFTLGNNDLFVHDQIGYGNGVADLEKHFLVWKDYIPTDQWETFKQGGYYAIVGHDVPLDIIVLNSLYFYTSNVLVADCSVEDSPGQKQLKWLEARLEACKKRGSFAYIVGHVSPSRGQYYPGCLDDFKRLVNEYASVIHAQFYGHSNNDEFFLTSNINSSIGRPRENLGMDDSFGLIAPPVVPLFNPAFRILEYDRSNDRYGQILDYWQYYVDLDEANEAYEKSGVMAPILRLEYSAKRFYGSGPLTAGYFRKVKEKIRRSSVMKEKYELFRFVSCVSCRNDPH